MRVHYADEEAAWARLDSGVRKALRDCVNDFSTQAVETAIHNYGRAYVLNWLPKRDRQLTEEDLRENYGAAHPSLNEDDGA